MIFPDTPKPEFTGQSVWRYNFKRTPDITGLQAYEGSIGIGLVPLSDELMYMYITTPAPLIMDQWGIGTCGPQTMPHPEPDKGLFQLVGV